jgi:uncharacterized RDD family membrane protein YckC
VSVAHHELTPVPREARSFQGHRAGVVTRLVAAVVDGGVVVLVLVAVYLGVAGVWFMLDPRGFSFPDASLFRSAIAAAFITGCYLTAAWRLGGRTYGNLLMGLRVVPQHGEHIGWIRCAVRAALCVLAPIGLLWAAVDRRSRSWADLVVRTAVVYDWRPHLPDRARGRATGE